MNDHPTTPREPARFRRLRIEPGEAPRPDRGDARPARDPATPTSPRTSFQPFRITEKETPTHG